MTPEEVQRIVLRALEPLAQEVTRLRREVERLQNNARFDSGRPTGEEEGVWSGFSPSDSASQQGSFGAERMSALVPKESEAATNPDESWPDFGADFLSLRREFEEHRQIPKQAAHLLVELYESAEVYRRRGQPTPEELERWQQLFEGLCDQHGVEVLRPLPDDPYCQSVHLVVRTVPGGVRDTIERGLSRGFRWGTKVLKKAEVVLHQG